MVSQNTALKRRKIIYNFQISTFLSGGRRPSNSHRSEDPAERILNKNSRRLQEIIAAAKNESLPDFIEDLIKEKESEGETSCIRLLFCKITPFINKMQNTVFGKDNMEINNRSGALGADILYRHLPTTDEIYKRSDDCEKQHTECDLDA